MAETNKVAAENEKTVEFLWKTSKLITEYEGRTQGDDLQTVKVQLRDDCVSHDEGVQFDRKIISAKKTCPKCLIFWSEGKFTLRLLSCHRRNKNSRRLLRKNLSELSRYQEKLHKLLSTPRDQIMELTCKVCHKVTKIPLLKPEISPNLVTVPLQECIKEELEIKQKKKKKKKKDRLAGLQPCVFSEKERHKISEEKDSEKEQTEKCHSNFSELKTNSSQSIEITEVENIINTSNSKTKRKRKKGEGTIIENDTIVTMVELEEEPKIKKKKIQENKVQNSNTTKKLNPPLEIEKVKLLHPASHHITNKNNRKKKKKKKKNKMGNVTGNNLKESIGFANKGSALMMDFLNSI